MKICKKFVAVLMAMLMVSSLFAIIPTASAAVISNPDYIGAKDYKITNPYASVNWDTWEIYRGATHIHSNISDGDDDFADIVEEYYSKGYDAIAMTDHGTVNYGWSETKHRHAIFAYQLATHGEAKGLSNARAAQMAQGVGRDGQHMVDIKYGNELNGACLKKVHVNSFFAACGDGYMGMAETWPTNAVEKAHNAGALTHLNHIGEWSGADEDISVYDDDFLSDFSEIFTDYSSCIGMELVNKGDGRTRNDRYLYDQLLMRLAPKGRNIFGFCEDDAHELDQVGKGVQFFVMPSNTMANVKTAMTNGTFFASSRSSRGELSGYGTSTAYDFPYVTRVDVDEEKDQISFEVDEAHTGFIVADGKTIDEIDCSDGTVTFDLNEYEKHINRYVRIYFIGNGGITYVQPFLLSSSPFKRATTQFTTTVKGANVVVKNSNGDTILPINNDYMYILDAGTYTYTATCPGYDSVSDTFTVTAANITNATQTKIALPFVDKFAGSKVTFYVPETIYLAPNSSTNFQYYADRASTTNGVLTSSATDATGDIYFACGDATSVTIKVSSVSSAKGGNSANYVSGAKATGQSFKGTITSGALSAGLDTNSGTVITWTATYTLADGSTKTATAYSYVYRPSSSNIAVGIDHEHSYSTNVENIGIFWGAGFNSIAGGTHTCGINFLTATPPTSSVGTSSFKNYWVAATDGGASYYEKDHSSNEADEHIKHGGAGYVTVDTSRTTNLSEVPTLQIGFWQYNFDGDNNGSFDLSIKMIEADGTETSLCSGNYDKLGEIYNSKIDYNLEENSTGSTQLTFYAYSDTSRGSRHNYNGYYLYVGVTAVNKDALRNTYNEAISNAYKKDYYDASAYNTLTSAIKTAGTVLGNPTASQSSINSAKTTLANAMAKMKRAGAPTVDSSQKFIYGLAENLTNLDHAFIPEDGYLVSYEGTTIGTGTKVKLTADGKTTEYNVVIFGDLDGNGIVDGNDSFLLTLGINGLLTADSFGDAAVFAADVNFDGRVDAADLDLITKAGLKQYTINQNRNGTTSTSVTTATDDVEIKNPDTEEDSVETTPLTPATWDFSAIIEMIKTYIKNFIDTVLSFIK